MEHKKKAKPVEPKPYDPTLREIADVMGALGLRIVFTFTQKEKPKPSLKTRLLKWVKG